VRFDNTRPAFRPLVSCANTACACCPPSCMPPQPHALEAAREMRWSGHRAARSGLRVWQAYNRPVPFDSPTRLMMTTVSVGERLPGSQRARVNERDAAPGRHPVFCRPLAFMNAWLMGNSARPASWCWAFYADFLIRVAVNRVTRQPGAGPAGVRNQKPNTWARRKSACVADRPGVVRHHDLHHGLAAGAGPDQFLVCFAVPDAAVFRVRVWHLLGCWGLQPFNKGRHSSARPACASVQEKETIQKVAWLRSPCCWFSSVWPGVRPDAGGKTCRSHARDGAHECAGPAVTRRGPGRAAVARCRILPLPSATREVKLHTTANSAWVRDNRYAFFRNDANELVYRSRYRHARHPVGRGAGVS